MTEPARVAMLVVGTIVTVDSSRRIIEDGAVAVEGGVIVAVGERRDLELQYRPIETLGRRDALVIPGLVNTHQHLTGDRLVRSTIPDRIDSDTAIFEWAIPVHTQHTPEDDELSAILALCESLLAGITTTVEAGTVAHPERVVSAYNAVGARGVIGTWGSDDLSVPFGGPVDEVLERQRAVVNACRDDALVSGWVTLVGHTLMSDDLATGAASLASELGVNLSMHMSPTSTDPRRYLERTGRPPIAHLENLDVLGPNVLIAHAVHVDDEEVECLTGSNTAVSYCPWAYLRLGQGVTKAGRHVEMLSRGVRVGLGCDSENAGDRLDILGAARLAAGLARDTTTDTSAFGAHDAFEMATIAGASAINMADDIGSLEAGKQADLVVIDRSGPSWQPHSDDPVLQLVWGWDPGSVSDVVVNGRIVLRDRVILGVDVAALTGEATTRRHDLLARSGLSPTSHWPMV